MFSSHYTEPRNRSVVLFKVLFFLLCLYLDIHCYLSLSLSVFAVLGKPFLREYPSKWDLNTCRYRWACGITSFSGPDWIRNNLLCRPSYSQISSALMITFINKCISIVFFCYLSMVKGLLTWLEFRHLADALIQSDCCMNNGSYNSRLYVACKSLDC